MTKTPTFDYDVIVIGSGAAGSPAASIIARTGRKVALIENSILGGESPNWGDIPVGTMLNTARAYNETKLAAEFGLRTSSVGYNYPSILSWKKTTIKRTGASGNRKYYEKQGISVFSGNAHFLSPNEISVNRRHLSARKFLIATGSDWEIPSITGIQDVKFHTPKTILDLTKPPKSLFIIGASSTAIEIAYLFATFGTKVYLATEESRILPKFDPIVSELINENSKNALGITILTKAKVLSVQKSGLNYRIDYAKGRSEYSVKTAEILISGDRLPHTDIGLENAGVKYSNSGILVHKNLQTSARHIFAAGSVVDQEAQTHEILNHSRIAANNLLHRSHIWHEAEPTLKVVFTDPQIAQVGLDTDDCKKRGLKINTALVPLAMTSRSNITNRHTGFVKVISDKKGVIIGASIVSPNASDLISELALAVKLRLKAKQLSSSPKCFTAWSEAVHIAVNKLA